LSKDEDMVNNLVAEVRVLESTYNDLSARQNLLERILMESESSLETIKGLSSSQEKEALVPVGGGVLLRAAPPATDKVLLNIGANVVVEKSREGATKFIEKRVGELADDIGAVASQRNQIASRLDSDRRALQSILSKQGQ
jgi:prefoldin alpha subunit